MAKIAALEKANAASREANKEAEVRASKAQDQFQSMMDRVVALEGRLSGPLESHPKIPEGQVVNGSRETERKGPPSTRENETPPQHSESEQHDEDADEEEWITTPGGQTVTVMNSVSTSESPAHMNKCSFKEIIFFKTWYSHGSYMQAWCLLCWRHASYTSSTCGRCTISGKDLCGCSQDALP